MAEVIVAFSNPENSRNIKNILVKRGFHVASVCMTAAQTLTAAENLDSGIVVCGNRFPDMVYADLRECLPAYLDMLVIAPPSHKAEYQAENLIFLAMPLKINELTGTMEMMIHAQDRRRRRKKKMPKARSEADLAILKQAKEILMSRNHMSENEAHRYLQTCSMENGSNLVETAQMVISLAEG
ncbi:MAG: ANTAR domain-containing response regulator [Lachnospiraceae bacterium]